MNVAKKGAEKTQNYVDDSQSRMELNKIFKKCMNMLRKIKHI